MEVSGQLIESKNVAKELVNVLHNERKREREGEKVVGEFAFKLLRLTHTSLRSSDWCDRT
jgi:hypothetical protein